MCKVAREMVEKARVDAGKLVKMLVDNAAPEPTTFYYHTILRINLIAGKDHRTCAEARPRLLWRRL